MALVKKGDAPDDETAIPAVLEYSSKYFLTKHSWRGKYKRLFAFTDKEIKTLDPANNTVTNAWTLDYEVLGCLPGDKGEQDIKLELRKKGGGQQTMKFIYEHRAHLLTDYCKAKATIDDDKGQKFSLNKITRNNERVPFTCKVMTYGILLTNDEGVVLSEYCFKDMQAFATISDEQGAFLISVDGGARSHLLLSTPSGRDDIIKLAQENAQKHIGVKIPKGVSSMQHAQSVRVNVKVDELAAYAEYSVYKETKRYAEPVHRLLALTEKHVVERDPATYSVVGAWEAAKIHSLVRSEDDAQRFCIIYRNGTVRRYTSTSRDNILTSILDRCRQYGSKDVCVNPSERSLLLRMEPVSGAVPDELDIVCVKRLANAVKDAGGNSSSRATLMATVYEFNQNVPYNGSCFDKKGAYRDIMNGLLARVRQVDNYDFRESIEILLALRRCIASRSGFAVSIEIPTFVPIIVECMKSRDHGVVAAALSVMRAAVRQISEPCDFYLEQANKRAFFGDPTNCGLLIRLVHQYSTSSNGALAIMEIVEMLEGALCDPYRETTELEYFDALLNLVAGLGRTLFRLFNHPCASVVESVGSIMNSISEDSPPEISHMMQDAALIEGAFLRHFCLANFAPSIDQREVSRQLVALWASDNEKTTDLLIRILPPGLLHYLKMPLCSEAELENLRVMEISREAELTRRTDVAGNAAEKKKMERLFKRIKPGGFRRRLLSLTNTAAEKVQEASEKAKERIRLMQEERERRRAEGQRASIDGCITPTMEDLMGDDAESVPEISEEELAPKVEKPKLNWAIMFHMIFEDHQRADLIWTGRQREELRNQLELEIRMFDHDQQLAGKNQLSWNHLEFEVLYESLIDEVRVSDYYLRPLLESGVKGTVLSNPAKFFDELYHRFLLESDLEIRALCLRGLAAVYGTYHSVIGPFLDIRYIVKMLEECLSRPIRDRLLLFLQALIHWGKNAKRFIDCDGINLIVELLTTVHLETNRTATPLQQETLMITNAPGAKEEVPKEWYYSVKDKQIGPVCMEELTKLYEEKVINPNTRCWAQGMDNWKKLSKIRQLRWALMITGPQVLSPTRVGLCCLDMLERLCKLYPSVDENGDPIRPVPRAKRILSEPYHLALVSQVLCTQDPHLVEKTARVLTLLTFNNDIAMPRLYLTGAFFFALMYGGSNLLTIAQMLKSCHTKQNIRMDSARDDEPLSVRSVLTPMLPEAMVRFLDYYAPDKFVETFLGNFDTPEAIWNSAMRKRMIAKIYLHVGEFRRRLPENTCAVYQYVPIPNIPYEELQDELWCHCYYLRNLCDTERFPEWPIRDHIELLQAVLLAWNWEHDKATSGGVSMSEAEAFKVLQISPNSSEDEIRKQYRKLALQYHPDKNPDGVEMFQKMQEAYNVIQNQGGKRTNTEPDPVSILLIIKCQVILFDRFPEIYEPYKYAGYGLLMDVLKPGDDVPIFAEEHAPHIVSGSKLIYLTCKCSPLNAHELLARDGIAVMGRLLDRCIHASSPETDPTAPAVQIATNLMHTFAGLGAFHEARPQMAEHPALLSNILHATTYDQAFQLVDHSLSCLSKVMSDSDYQNRMLDLGILYHVVPILFGFDKTAEGIEMDQQGREQHEQLAHNFHAKMAARVLGRLGGYMLDNLRTPVNERAQTCLSHLLTPPLAKMFMRTDPCDLLGLLTSNVETPYIIWNNESRADLTDFLDQMKTKHKQSGEHDPMDCTSVKYKIITKELQIGGVFIRVYNKEVGFSLEDPTGFVTAVVAWLSDHMQHNLQAPEQGTEDKKWKKFIERRRAVMTALSNCVRTENGSEGVIAREGASDLLFHQLLVDDEPLQKTTLDIVHFCSKNGACQEDMATSMGIARLLYLVQLEHVCLEPAMLALGSLVGVNTKLTSQIVARGSVLYLLAVMCGTSNDSMEELREQAAFVLSKIVNDKVHGTKVGITLTKFLPPGIVNKLKDNPQDAVGMIDRVQETPEVIWTDNCQQALRKAVKSLLKEFMLKQFEDETLTWELPHDWKVSYPDFDDEVFVGGVYLRLFLKDPSWPLRDSRQFLEELLAKFVSMGTGNAHDSMMELITMSVTNLIKIQVALADHVSSLGHLPKLMQFIGNKELDPAIRECSLRIIHILSGSSRCAETMGSIGITMKCMKSYMEPMDDNMDIALDALKRMTAQNVCEKGCYSEQALKCDAIEFLLSLLDVGTYTKENSPTVRAHSSGVLKNLANDMVHGPQVDEILDASPIWATYKHQKHDLFLPSNVDTSAAPRLLTDGRDHGMGKRLLDAPPPMMDGGEAGAGALVLKPNQKTAEGATEPTHQEPVKAPTLEDGGSSVEKPKQKTTAKTKKYQPGGAKTFDESEFFD